jgi:hypothetical protein
MKVIKEGDKIVAYRHWFKWYWSGYMAATFRPRHSKGDTQS